MAPAAAQGPGALLSAQRMEVAYVAFSTVVDGKTVEIWGLSDIATMVQHD